jgi:DNA-binding beta-propeller fold protein YncE
MISPGPTSSPNRRRLPWAVRTAAATFGVVGVAAFSAPIAHASAGTPTSGSAQSHLSTTLPPITVPVGASPFGIVADRVTGTVYVANDAGVDLIDGNTCNAHEHKGCGSILTTVLAGHGNIGITLDSTAHTVYVASGTDGTVGVIDTTTCSARTTAGCAGPHPAAPVGSLPSHVVADPAHHTLYVSNEGATTQVTPSQ